VLTLPDLEPLPDKGAVHRALSFLRPYLLGVAGSAFLFTVGWLRPRHRAAIVQLGHHFGYQHESREPGLIRSVSPAEIADPRASIEIRAMDAEDGNVTDRELVTICQIVKRVAPDNVFEIGTFNGRTTLNLAINAPAATVYTLDLPRAGVASSEKPLHRHELVYAEKEVSGIKFLGTEMEKNIVQLFGDSGSFDFMPYAHKIDLIFIDGSHTFEYVVNDSLNALQMLKPGGVILWHDYGRWDGVTAALNQLQRKHPSFAGLTRIEGTTLAALRT
jgi:predicted O-methyltransferase YrrM